MTWRQLSPAFAAAGPEDPAAPVRDDARPTDQAAEWGRFFPMLVLGATGLLWVALADDLARKDVPGAQVLFFAALLLTYLPLALGALAPGASRRERIASLAALALLLSLVKVLMQPTSFTFNDEFM